MARGTALSVLLSMWKAEVGNDLDSDVSPGGDDIAMAGLALMQKWLATEVDWPFLAIRAEVPMVAATRYYTFPTVQGFAFELEREIVAECYWGTLWTPVRLGIQLNDYNFINPELGSTLDPVRKWQLYNSGIGAVTQFEVWPVPGTATRLRLTGQRALNVLAAGTDTADLDDSLIVLFYAAKYLQRLKSSDASTVLAQAQKRLERLRGGYPTESQVFNMNDGRSRNRRDENRPTVATMIIPP